MRLDRGTPGRIGTGRRVGAAGPSDSTDRSACLSVVPCAVSWRFGITHDVDTHPLFALAQLARHSFRNMDDVMGLSVGSFAEDEACSWVKSTVRQWSDDDAGVLELVRSVGRLPLAIGLA